MHSTDNKNQNARQFVRCFGPSRRPLNLDLFILITNLRRITSQKYQVKIGYNCYMYLKEFSKHHARQIFHFLRVARRPQKG